MKRLRQGNFVRAFIACVLQSSYHNHSSVFFEGNLSVSAVLDPNAGFKKLTTRMGSGISRLSVSAARNCLVGQCLLRRDRLSFLQILASSCMSPEEESKWDWTHSEKSPAFRCNHVYLVEQENRKGCFQSTELLPREPSKKEPVAC
jgi:hypothetical protein